MTWMTAGEQLAKARAMLGATQEEMAARAEVGITTWQELERGKEKEYRATTLAKIERAIGVPVGWLSDLAYGRHQEVLEDRALLAREVRGDGMEVGALRQRTRPIEGETEDRRATMVVYDWSDRSSRVVFDDEPAPARQAARRGPTDLDDGDRVVAEGRYRLLLADLYAAKAKIEAAIKQLEGNSADGPMGDAGEDT